MIKCWGSCNFFQWLIPRSDNVMFSCSRSVSFRWTMPFISLLAPFLLICAVFLDKLYLWKLNSFWACRLNQFLLLYISIIPVLFLEARWLILLILLVLLLLLMILLGFSIRITLFKSSSILYDVILFHKGDLVWIPKSTTWINKWSSVHLVH